MIQVFLLLTLLSTTVSAQHHDQHKISGPDLRKPLPLLEFMAEHQKKNMREHLEVIRDIVGGFVKKDFKVIKEASLRLGSSPQMNVMCDHMGQGAPGFTPMALQMHKNADQIVAAAEKKDFEAVIQATQRTLNSCTSCHALYKQQIVSEVEWNKLLKK